MKPTINDIKTYFKPDDIIKNPKNDVTCKFSDINMIWDNGTGGYNAFTNDGKIIILYSGYTNKFSDIIKK